MEKIVPFHLIPGCEEIDSFTEVEEGDLIVLAELCGIGSDLSKARRCFHYFCFPSDEGARHAASDLAAMDFEALIGGYLQSEPETRRWPVRAERTEVVNAEIIRALRGPLSELAERNGGTYDGWAASAD